MRRGTVRAYPQCARVIRWRDFSTSYSPYPSREGHIMANVDHVALVKQGAERIDQWRKEHPNEGLDLHEADLQGAALQGANLQDADLQGAALQGANLQDADLQGAALQGASLQGAALQ